MAVTHPIVGRGTCVFVRPLCWPLLFFLELRIDGFVRNFELLELVLEIFAILAVELCSLAAARKFDIHCGQGLGMQIILHDVWCRLVPQLIVLFSELANPELELRRPLVGVTAGCAHVLLLFLLLLQQLTSQLFCCQLLSLQLLL